MKALSIFFLLFIYSACTPSQENKHSSDSLKVSAATIPNDSLSIDLLFLKKQGLLKNTQLITVKNDPVYHQTKRFNALPFNEILEKYSKVKQLNAANTKVVFECEDGYKPEMPLERIQEAKVFLAVSDADAPAGKEWIEPTKGNQVMKAEPFYLIYENVSEKDADYKWPYNLVKIHLAASNENMALIKPKDAAALKGFELFQKYCQTCHSINNIGGKMGPELNYPKNVSEYWKLADLQAFIKNPAAYRHEVKMPTLGLQNADIQEITRYLQAMSKQKELH